LADRETARPTRPETSATPSRIHTSKSAAAVRGLMVSRIAEAITATPNTPRTASALTPIRAANFTPEASAGWKGS
jgi:hypothetical protein